MSSDEERDAGLKGQTLAAMKKLLALMQHALSTEDDDGRD